MERGNYNVYQVNRRIRDQALKVPGCLYVKYFCVKFLQAQRKFLFLAVSLVFYTTSEEAYLKNHHLSFWVS